MQPENENAYIDPEADLTEYIVGKIQQGDRASFDQLFNRYRERILRVVRAKLLGRLAQHVEAEDILQEVWVKAYRQFSTFRARGHGSFRSWIMTIVARVIVDTARRYSAQKRASRGKAVLSLDAKITDSTIALADKIASSARTPSTKTWIKENLAWVKEAIDSLPERQRGVITARYLEGYTIAETAERIGISQEAVRVATMRGLKALTRKVQTREST